MRLSGAALQLLFLPNRRRTVPPHVTSPTRYATCGRRSLCISARIARGGPARRNDSRRAARIFTLLALQHGCSSGRI